MSTEPLGPDELRELIKEERERDLVEYGAIQETRIWNRVFATVEERPLEAHEFLWHVFKSLFNRLGRDRRSGIRDTDNTRDAEGERIDKPFEQMTLFEARDVVARKFAHARGSFVEARRDQAVLRLAEERCAERGLDPATTKILSLVRAHEIVKLREAA